jgi:ElaB/YqjD/DUF883 family membrane-anchored ribosome-binding protein
MGPEQSLMTNQELHEQESRSSPEIESDIRQTRGRMDATLDELSDRLSARSLLNSALDWWESRGVGSRPVGATKDTYQSVARYVKENPIPSLLVGAGVAWMIIEATTEDDDKGDIAGRVDFPYEGSTASSYRAEFPETQMESGGGSGLVENAKNKLGEAKEAVSGVAGTVKEKVAAVGEAASQTAEELGHRAQNVYQQSSSTALTVGRNLQRGYQSSAAQLENAMEEYPLAVGIGFAALGALIGVLLPRTRQEDELVGEQSDQLVKATKEKGEELLQRGKAVAQRVSESALEEAGQQGFTPEAVGDKISEFAGKVGEVVQKAKEEAGTAAKDEKLTVEHLKEEASSAAEGGKQDRKARASKKSAEEG